MDNAHSAASGVTLLDLLLQIGMVASIASMLVRSRRFKFLLFEDRKSPASSAQLAAYLGFAFILGVLLRFLLGYGWADASLQGSLLAGLVGGPVVGLIVGATLGLPEVFLGEWVGLVVVLSAGIAGGCIRAAIPGGEGVWSFSPFTLMSIFRFAGTWIKTRRLDWRVVLAVAAIFFELLAMLLHERFPKALFAFTAPGPLLFACILVKGIMCIGIPIKIWNNTRIEILLEEQEAALLKTRYDALKRQINPHFLFNTLNSIASLIRSDPGKAREMVIKLSHILRQLLQENDLVPLKHELDFIDSYLAIERIRFGEEKLQVRKQIDPDTLSVELPSMLLQPIIENAVRHGISRKVEGGAITIRTAVNGGNVVIGISDDGQGFSPPANPGIGLSNVKERLRVCYGERHSFSIEPAEGGGTLVKLAIPMRPAAVNGERK